MIQQSGDLELIWQSLDKQGLNSYIPVLATVVEVSLQRCANRNSGEIMLDQLSTHRIPLTRDEILSQNAFIPSSKILNGIFPDLEAFILENDPLYCDINLQMSQTWRKGSNLISMQNTTEFIEIDEIYGNSKLNSTSEVRLALDVFSKIKKIKINF